MDALKDAIRNFIVKEYVEDDDQAVTDTTPLISSGIVDSFSMVSLMRFLERTCEIGIPDSRATPEAFDTVEKIAALVRSIKPEA